MKRFRGNLESGIVHVEVEEFRWPAMTHGGDGVMTL